MQMTANAASCGRGGQRGGRGGRDDCGGGSRGGFGRNGAGRTGARPPPSKKPQCQICSKVGHTADRCWNRYDEDFVVEEETANVVDTACTVILLPQSTSPESLTS